MMKKRSRTSGTCSRSVTTSIPRTMVMLAYQDDSEGSSLHFDIDSKEFINGDYEQEASEEYSEEQEEGENSIETRNRMKYPFFRPIMKDYLIDGKLIRHGSGAVQLRR